MLNFVAEIFYFGLSYLGDKLSFTMDVKAADLLILLSKVLFALP